jgi:hypothetical protein
VECFARCGDLIFFPIDLGGSREIVLRDYD